MTTSVAAHNQRTKAILYIIITAVLWSVGGLLIKSVNSNPLAIAGTRSAIAAVVLLIYLRKPKFTWSLSQIGAAIAYTATVIFFVCANKMTTAANAILLQYTAPVYVALLGAWLLKEKTHLFDWITILLTFAGMTLFFIGNINATGLLGNVFALLSGVSFAFFAIFMRMQKDGSPLESVLLGNILTAIIGVPFLFQQMPNGNGWLGLLLLGVFQLGIPYIFYALAVKHLTALEVILIPVLEPVLNPIWVFFMIGEFPGVWSIVGGVVVITIVTLRCVLPEIQKKRAKRKELQNVDLEEPVA